MSAMWPPHNPSTPLAVLCSGGLDSAILLGEALHSWPRVTPIYVRVGTVWEDTEQQYLQQFLKVLSSPVLAPLVVLDQPVRDLYSAHWSMTGRGVPGLDTPDEAAYLPGRNLLLFVKPLLWCLANNVPELATAPLVGNPFPDATPQFYDGLAALAGRAVRGRVRILRPYAEMCLQKADVLRRGRHLPLQHTFSCNRPCAGRPCRECNKCGERQQAFRAAGFPDPAFQD